LARIKFAVGEQTITNTFIDSMSSARLLRPLARSLQRHAAGQSPIARPAMISAMHTKAAVAPIRSPIASELKSFPGMKMQQPKESLAAKLVCRSVPFFHRNRWDERCERMSSKC